MLKTVITSVPSIKGAPITFSQEERQSFLVDGRFIVALLHLTLAHKALAAYLSSLAGEQPNSLRLKDFSVTKAQRRFWGNSPSGYHIIRLHIECGKERRKVSLRFVRDSRDNFDGHLYHHPLRAD